MQFIFNFIFFGILFYLIYLFFPEAFSTLVSWVNHIYEFLRDLVMQLIARFQAWRNGSHETTSYQVLLDMWRLF